MTSTVETRQEEAVERVLNLGSGAKVEDGLINFDVTAAFNPDVQGTARSLPFKDGSFDAIVAYHVLEHIERRDLIPVMNECWRVLREGGEIRIELPLFPSEKAMSDPTHVSFFTAVTFDYFMLNGHFEDHRVMYGIKPWEMLERAKAGMADILFVRMAKINAS